MSRYGDKIVKKIFGEKCVYVVMKIWGAKIATGNPTSRLPSTIIHVALSWPEANHMLHVQNQSWRHFCNVRKSLGQSLTKEGRGKL